MNTKNGGHFRDLKVWQRSIDLSVGVYAATRTFPDDERYGLISQMRRAAASIPANVAEGSARRGQGEFLQFLHVAAGSLAELETFLELARRLDYCEEEVLTSLDDLATEVGRMLYGLIAHVKGSRK
ncbi:MAG: four helix bundle protein [Armatimonadota bacterium]